MLRGHHVRAVGVVYIIPLLLMVAPPAEPALAQESYGVESLFLRVHLDGTVTVEYLLNVDYTVSMINVTLVGKERDYLVVVDEQDILLDYTTIEGGLGIHTLGASNIRITYSTPDLVSKTGRVWSFMVEALHNLTILFPVETAIISLNTIPLLIENIDGQYLLTMPAGKVRIDYVIGLTGRREHALLTITLAEKVVQQVKLMYIVTEAEARLVKAKEAYTRRDYVAAEHLASEAKEIAVKTNLTATKAKGRMVDARQAISRAEREGRTSWLEEARRLLTQAEARFLVGEYEKAYADADQAFGRAVSSPLPQAPPLMWSPLLLVGAIGITGLAVTLTYFLTRRRAPPSVPSEPVREIDVERILEGRLHLREEDREVIRFLAECGGEAFEAEIRDRFRLPKTTVWRMIKRLKREEVVEVRKVGGQNLIRLRSDGEKEV